MDKLKKLSQILFVLGSLTAVGAVVYTYYLNKTSPPGFCPINPARPYMWVGVVLLSTSLVLDGWMWWKHKKMRVEE